MEATESFSALSATTSALPALAPAPDLSIGPYLVQLLLVTLLMVGLGYVSLRLTKNGRMPGLTFRPKGIKVLDRLALDAKRQLMVVNVGKRNWLVGMSEGGFNAIAELDDEDLTPDFEKLVAEAEPHEPRKRTWWQQALGLGLIAGLVTLLLPMLPAHAQAAGDLAANAFGGFDLRNPLGAPNMTTSVSLIILLATLTVLPFLVVMTTSFMRTIIVLGFLRQALGTQSIPPNPVMLGLALFLAMYTMTPVWNTIDKTALQPYFARQISQPVMLERAQAPLKEFMLRQTSQQELGFFIRLSNTPAPNTPADVPLQVVIPAFMVSELTTAFKIGFIIYVPFIVIDLVVSNVLLALGMSSLPPQMISNAFKLLVFTLANGWHLVMAALVQSFK
ncbi:flagellar type III secretion system pore protein FliP [bacterium]|nr:flagellar type III secretion system pore protein FliP [bacterium]